MCVSTSKVGLIVIAFFIAFTIGGAFYKMPELIGRKKVVIITGAINIAAHTAILLFNSLFVRTVCFGLMGLT